jgi:hypothetical protein
VPYVLYTLCARAPDILALATHIPPNRPGIAGETIKKLFQKCNFFFFSLEMEEERVYNELSHATGPGGLATPTGAQSGVHRTRTVSSPVPVVGGLGQTGPSPSASITSNSRPLSPGLNYGEGNTLQRRESGHTPLFTPPTIMHGRVHSLTTPPGGPGMLVGVPSPSPPPGPAGLPPSRGRGHPNPPILPPTTNKTS